MQMKTLLFALAVGTVLTGATTERLDRPTNLRTNYVTADDQVRVRWNQVTGAKRYTLEVIRKSTDERIKKVNASVRDKRFAATQFLNGANYTIRVRATPKSDRYRTSRWRNITYRHRLAEPTLTTALDATAIPGTNQWLFAIDDGEDQLATSAEAGGTVLMGRVDPLDAASFNVNNWTTVLTSANTEGQSIADHWHSYAHGSHWIVASTSGASKSILAKLNTDFEIETVTTIVENDPDVMTNDMFLVAEPDGVTVGHFLPGTGHRLYRFNTEAVLVDTVDIGGGEDTHANGAAAVSIDDGFLVLAPTSLDPSNNNALKLLRYSPDWEVESVDTLLSATDSNFAMATLATLDNHYLVTARVISPLADDSSGDDSGSIVRYLFDETWNQLDSTTLFADAGNRPHTILLDNNQLVTTFDSEGSTWLQTETVE